MKYLITSIFLATISFTAIIQATPDRHITSTTTLIGSTSETYTTQTKTTDNKGSYYISIQTITLNTYQKAQKKSIPLKTIRLLETRTESIDRPITIKTIHKDKSILLGDLLETHQQSSIYTWPKEKYKDWSSEYDLRAGNLSLNDLQAAKKVIYGDPYSKSPISIDKIQEHEKCLYVTVSNQLKSDESDDTEHIIYVPKNKTQQIQDRAYRQQTYLSYGTYQTLEEAQVAVSSLTKIFKINKDYNSIEIWTSRLNHETVYQTVLSNSTGLIEKRKTRTIEDKYNIRLEPIQGRHLYEKFPLTH